jgi:hypothetical protein
MDWMDDPASIMAFNAVFADDDDGTDGPHDCLCQCPKCDPDGYCHHGDTWGECDLCDDEWADRFGLSCEAHGEVGCEECDPAMCHHGNPHDCAVCAEERGGYYRSEP